MTSEPTPVRLSAPPRRSIRELTDSELAAARAVADVLVPRHGEDPAATEDPDFGRNLARALSARPDAFDTITALLRDLDISDRASLRSQLRDLDSEDRDRFQALSTVVAGAWLISPSTRDRIGYPGQLPSTYPLDAGTEELSEELLEPVFERGPVGRPTPMGGPDAYS
jgi:hypothetical protein